MSLKALSYDDVALVPEYFDGESRSSIDTSARLGDFEFDLPVVPANMKCVIDMDLARSLQANNLFYVMHRFDNNPVAIMQQMYDEKWLCKSISLGVKNVDYDIIDELSEQCLTPHFITVDVAHGHCKMMKYILKYIKLKLPSTFVIAGNVATPQGCEDLANWGADAVKVGIGPGKSCITKLKTGFYSPMFSTVKNIHSVSRVPVIADGGIQHNGDVAKAVVAGATMIMAGSIFAQCKDSPADSINGEKVYFGSASAENKGHKKNVEGKQLLMHNNGMTVLEKMSEIQQDLQSAISYAGGVLSYSTKWIQI